MDSLSNVLTVCTLAGVPGKVFMERQLERLHNVAEAFDPDYADIMPKTGSMLMLVAETARVSEGRWKLGVGAGGEFAGFKFWGEGRGRWGVGVWGAVYLERGCAGGGEEVATGNI